MREISDEVRGASENFIGLLRKGGDRKSRNKSIIDEKYPYCIYSSDGKFTGFIVRFGKPVEILDRNEEKTRYIISSLDGRVLFCPDKGCPIETVYAVGGKSQHRLVDLSGEMERDAGFVFPADPSSIGYSYNNKKQG